MFTPVLLRAVIVIGGISLAAAGGSAAFDKLSSLSSPSGQGSMAPVAFRDANGEHRILRDSSTIGGSLLSRTAPADAAEPQTAKDAPPVMTIPDQASTAAPSVPQPAPAVAIVRVSPAPAIAPSEADDDAGPAHGRHFGRGKHNVEHGGKHHGEEG